MYIYINIFTYIYICIHQIFEKRLLKNNQRIKILELLLTGVCAVAVCCSVLQCVAAD